MNTKRRFPGLQTIGVQHASALRALPKERCCFCVVAAAGALERLLRWKDHLCRVRRFRAGLDQPRALCRHLGLAKTRIGTAAEE